MKTKQLIAQRCGIAVLGILLTIGLAPVLASDVGRP
jgi:hypothetical protein